MFIMSALMSASKYFHPKKDAVLLHEQTTHIKVFDSLMDLCTLEFNLQIINRSALFGQIT